MFNYSNIEVSEAIEKLFNKGLNFSVLPNKLDITQVLVDYKRYERSTIWTEFWYGKEQLDQNIPIFKQIKSNLPKNYSVPEDLKIFLNSVKSEFMDHRNRNSVLCNLPPDELQALKQLQELQRDRKIVVKPCDKGAGVILMNFEDYLKSCYEHLTSLQSENNPYYIQVSELAIEEAKIIIGNILDKALENEIITKEEHKAMSAEDKKNQANFIVIIRFTNHMTHYHPLDQ